MLYAGLPRGRRRPAGLMPVCGGDDECIPVHFRVRERVRCGLPGTAFSAHVMRRGVGSNCCVVIPRSVAAGRGLLFCGLACCVPGQNRNPSARCREAR